MPNPNTKKPRKKTGPKPPGGVNRVKVTVWISPAARDQLQAWTAESQHVNANASDGATVELMVAACQADAAAGKPRPVLKPSPAASPSSP